MRCPPFGTLVCEGPAEALLAPRDGGGLEIALAHGRLGVQDLAAGKEIRFQAGGASWTARGIDHYSTLAVLADPAAPQLLVPTGAVAVDQFNVAAQQRMLWQQGLVQPPQPIAASSAAMNAAPPPCRRSAIRWTWRGSSRPTKTAASNSRRFTASWSIAWRRPTTPAGELTKLLEASKDARTAALLSRWNAALADDAGRADADLGDAQRPPRCSCGWPACARCWSCRPATRG